MVRTFLDINNSYKIYYKQRTKLTKESFSSFGATIVKIPEFFQFFKRFIELFFEIERRTIIKDFLKVCCSDEIQCVWWAGDVFKTKRASVDRRQVSFFVSRRGDRIGQDFIQGIEMEVDAIIQKALNRAKKNRRTTLFAQDLW